MPTVPVVEQYWTTKQVAARLQVTTDCVKKWLARKILKKTKAGTKTLISESDLQRFLKKSTAAAAATSRKAA